VTHQDDGAWDLAERPDAAVDVGLEVVERVLAGDDLVAVGSKWRHELGERRSVRPDAMGEGDAFSWGHLFLSFIDVVS
jgi:hypothetical protein